MNTIRNKDLVIELVLRELNYHDDSVYALEAHKRHCDRSIETYSKRAEECKNDPVSYKRLINHKNRCIKCSKEYEIKILQHKNTYNLLKESLDDLNNL